MSCLHLTSDHGVNRTKKSNLLPPMRRVFTQMSTGAYQGLGGQSSSTYRTICSFCKRHILGTHFRFMEGFPQMSEPKRFLSTPKFGTHYYVPLNDLSSLHLVPRGDKNPIQMVLKIMKRGAGRSRNQQGGGGTQRAVTAGSHGIP